MARAQLGELSIHYDTEGERGTPVLLLMGFTMPGRVWRFQIPALAAHHRVCWYDHRGVGGSDAPAPPYSMAQLSADALGLLDHLGWEGAHIVGVSMGGMVAQHLALARRDRVRSLTLIATTAGGFWGRLPTSRGLWLLARAMFGPQGGRARATTTLLFPEPFRREIGDAWLREVIAHDFAERPPKAGRKGQLRAVMGHDTRRSLGALSGLPTLIVKPEDDILIRPNQSERLHALIGGSKILRVPGAGHGLLRQSAGAINAALLDHLAAADDVFVSGPARRGEAGR